MGDHDWLMTSRHTLPDLRFEISGFWVEGHEARRGAHAPTHSVWGFEFTDQQVKFGWFERKGSLPWQGAVGDFLTFRQRLGDTFDS